MTYIPQKLLNFETFLDQYGDNPRYEIADGELVEMEPTEPHETVSGKLATQIASRSQQKNFPGSFPALV
jgi:Uma2 family endonuclease